MAAVVLIAWCLLTAALLATVVSATLRRDGPAWEYLVLATLAGVGATAAMPLASYWVALTGSTDLVAPSFALAAFGLVSGAALGLAAATAPAIRRGVLVWITLLWIATLLGLLGGRWRLIVPVILPLAVGVLGYVAGRRGERLPALGATVGPAVQIAGHALHVVTYVSNDCPGVTSWGCEPVFTGVGTLVILFGILCVVVGAGLIGAIVGRALLHSGHRLAGLPGGLVQASYLTGRYAAQYRLIVDVLLIDPRLLVKFGSRRCSCFEVDLGWRPESWPRRRPCWR